ncbi:hypothetical protein [Thalassorhabdomicrobium marinisediminis]|uniref:hypothetical protein n=1 Tax=Thalassorhabdomicrobium marinisediminis TaxID=2170577 RepID=UPI00249061A7|nr:hypothetical protein [Thalassorhabdomicrobium marinisediminis]
MTRDADEVIFHIGLHKTGTTSFQVVMHKHREDFLSAGIDPYQTERGRTAGQAKHGDLALAAIRSGVLDAEAPGNLMQGVNQDELFDRTQQAIQDYIDASDQRRFLISAETLSLFRTRAEVARLKALFGNRVQRFSVVVVLRDRAEWLESYRNQTIKGNTRPSTDPRSAFYLEGDNWLTDFDTLIETYRAECDEVTVIDYDRNDVVGQLARAMGVDITFNSTAYRRNQAVTYPRLTKIPRLVLRRIFGSENRGVRRKIRDLRERWKS